MLNRLFPKQFDNNYQGNVIGIVLLIPLTLVKLLQGGSVAGLNPWVSSGYIIETADRVHLANYPAGAAAEIVFLFSVWGLSILVLSLFALLALIRYRAMIPLAYLLFLIEQLGRKTLGTVHLGADFFAFKLTTASLINWAFLAAIIIGFLASLAARRPR